MLCFLNDFEMGQSCEEKVLVWVFPSHDIQLKLLRCCRRHIQVICSVSYTSCTWQVQWWTIENHQDPFYVVNEVTLTGQKPSLEFCQPLEIFTQFKKSIDLLMLKIRDLQIEGLQSYWPSNFQNDLTPGAVESGPKAIAHSSAVKAQSLMASNFSTL